MMIDVDWRQPFIDYLGQELGRATHPPGQVLRPRRRQALQAGRIFWSTHEVCPQTRRQGHLGGDP
jgi:hypothetical protein